ncbi:MAG: response regulator [Acidobacteriota bacterium]|nr:response regulator [Acidobacteriota bacterium]
MTDIRQKLAAIFQGEHAEHLEHLRSILALLENVASTKGRTEIDEAFRRAHSLKGAARAVDLDTVEELASGLETLFSRVREGSLPLDQQATRVIHAALDASEECVGAFRENRNPDPPAAALRGMGELLGTELRLGEAPPDLPAKSSATQSTPGSAPGLTPGPAAPGVSQAASQPAEMVRLPAENLDRLVRSTGLILAESLRQASVTGELEALDAQIAEIGAEFVRFRKASAAALWRLASQTEYASITRHIGWVEQKVRSLTTQSRAAHQLQQRSSWNTRRSAEQLQRDVWSARMAPAEDLFEAFRKMVRDLAAEENKEIDFRLSGSSVRADRIVLQALKDPVMHLLRNAISHGIETREQRVSQGKSPVGSLLLRLDSQRGRLIVEVDDDGRGVDLKKVAKVLAEDEPGAHSSEELAQAIFRPGFSTSATVNHLSGRGMGLSVVYETVHRLQGDVVLRPKDSAGASFLLSVPLSVSTSHLLVLSAAGQTFGIPTHGIERLYRVPLEKVETLQGKPVVILEGHPVPLHGLAQLLQIGDAAPALPGDMLPVMMLKSGDRRFAVWVDEFLTERDALIQELGMACPTTGNVSGGALLRAGTVFVVLNPAGLAGSCSRSGASVVPRKATPVVQALASGILVVDDSITSRSLEKSILEAHGYRVRTAVDGLEALELLRAEKADLIITDIQMPRMDGFGLVEALKADSRLKGIPVIIVSSLESPEDQERGLLLGADAYVVKRKFDQTELLDAIRQML